MSGLTNAIWGWAATLGRSGGVDLDDQRRAVVGDVGSDVPEVVGRPVPIIVVRRSSGGKRRRPRRGRPAGVPAARAPGRPWSHRLFGASLGGRAVVVKVYASAGWGEPVREWEALRALDGTGLVPAPLGADLDGEPPVVVMSRVPGRARSLAGLTDPELDLLADVHRRVHAVRPPSGRPATGTSTALLSRAAATLRRGVPETGHGGLRSAMSEALAWLESAAQAGPAGGPVVFGRGDPNGANYLWSGGRVTLVDFEDAGTTDPAAELGDLLEHAANRGLSEAAIARLAAGWGVDRPALLRARRIAACSWLAVLAERERHGLPARQVTAGEQAERVLALLGTA
jgi:hypothetical protein